MHRHVLLVVLLATFATACRRDSQEPPTGPAGPPEVIGIVSGNGQLGAVDRPLLESFIVRVTDINGTPVQGVTVNWEIASGGGSLGATSTLAQPLQAMVWAADGRPVPGYPVDWAVTSGDGSLSNSASLSDATGAAAAGLTVGPTPDTTTVEAESTGLTSSPVEFEAFATAPVSVTVVMQNLAFVAPGGSAFDSPLLSLNDTFDFVPNVRGTWTYFCRVHPDVMRDATITVN